MKMGKCTDESHFFAFIQAIEQGREKYKRPRKIKKPVLHGLIIAILGLSLLII